MKAALTYDANPTDTAFANVLEVGRRWSSCAGDQLPDALGHQAVPLYESYVCTGKLAPLDHAIELRDQLIPLRPQGIKRAISIDHQAAWLYERWQKSNDLTDLDRAIELMTAALADVDVEIEHLNELASFLESRYKITRNIKDLNRVIEIKEVALSLSPESQRFLSLNKLSVSLSDRYQATSELADLRRAVYLGEEALSLSKEGSSRAR